MVLELKDRPKLLSTANVSLLIAISTAFFSVYQWLANGEDSVVKATVEYMVAYAGDSAAVTDKYIFLELLKKDARPVPADYDFNTDAETPESIRESAYLRHLGRMDYVAYLLVSERFDRNYISTTMFCDLFVAAANVDRPLLDYGGNKEGYKDSFKNLADFSLDPMFIKNFSCAQ